MFLLGRLEGRKILKSKILLEYHYLSMITRIIFSLLDLQSRKPMVLKINAQ
jgi:hypothetical protein